MSAWYIVQGSIIIRKDSHCSLRACIENAVNPECKPSVVKVSESNDTYTYEVEWTNSQENEYAVNEIRLFVDILKTMDSSVKIDLDCNIRWIT